MRAAVGARDSGRPKARLCSSDARAYSRAIRHTTRHRKSALPLGCMARSRAAFTAGKFCRALLNLSTAVKQRMSWETAEA